MPTVYNNPLKYEKIFIFIHILLLSAKSFAQDKDFNYKFYGQIRTDFYYNSRANEETVDGSSICILKIKCTMQQVKT